MPSSTRVTHKVYRSDADTLRKFGSFIAHRRLARGISAQALAAQLGISSSMITRIEQGNREPRLEILRMLHVALGIEDAIVSYLTTGEFPLPDGFVSTPKPQENSNADQQRT